ncbi:hypothetical protein BOTBODRAFT_66718 [Botryobasidium botryosum FD-172 SS1]|uniref:Checkpoint protein n=1 Tax=Botryobasidium botryosum (strain FD-172 SS1) TaxID=930990 RepID=A0A067MD68_BOTB1|nr:hypothetical protein BOTBODRAFT_66718 [Botryobasidium botryosum FD-172 SS1]
MRFRANIEHVSTFSHIIQSVEKLSKRCIIKLSETALQIICAETEGGVQVWSRIKVDSLFSEYRIQSNSNNEINLELSTESLLQALKSANESSEVMFKLAKKGDHPVLTFEILTKSHQGKKMQITHDVRILVKKPSDMEKIKEPLCPEPDVHIVLPPLSKMRIIAEHFSQVSNMIGVSANRSGELILSIQTDDVKVETQWSGCEHPIIPKEVTASQEPQEEAEVDPAEYHRILVTSRSLLKFLSSYVISTTTIACICSDYCLIMYVYIGEVDDAGGVLTYYIPSRSAGSALD